MLDVKLIRSEPDVVAKKLLIRGFVLNIEYLDELESKRRKIQGISQNLQSERNSHSKMMGKAISEAQNQNEINLLKKKGEELKKSCAEAENKLNIVKTELEVYLSSVPNLPDDIVPSGIDESSNLEVRRWGSIKKFPFKIKNHVELGEALGMLDFESATKIASTRFSVMRGDIARMHRALSQFMLDTHQLKHGYEEVNVPYVVNQDSLYGTGQLPKFEKDLFKLQDERGLYLAPTAEVPVTNIYRGQIIDAQELPIKLTSNTTCFINEAGSYGKDTKGMIRQHQFEKVELVQFVDPKSTSQAVE